MDSYVRFNRSSICDRQVDTLVGLSKGLVADGVVNQSEAEFLVNWLIQNQQATENPVISNLLDRISAFLKDDVLDQEESQDLFNLLSGISGPAADFAELSHPATLPIDTPPPSICFPGTHFLFTGTCKFGPRRVCQQAVDELGGVNLSSVTKQLDYLVLGSYVTDSWVHESFGRKIEKAVKYRDTGVPLAIVTEDHWLAEAGFGA